MVGGDIPDECHDWIYATFGVDPRTYVETAGQARSNPASTRADAATTLDAVSGAPIDPLATSTPAAMTKIDQIDAPDETSVLALAGAPGGSSGGPVMTPSGGGEDPSSLPIPIYPDCAPKRGEVDGPANHVLCATHGHVYDETTGMIIAASVHDYDTRLFPTPRPMEADCQPLDGQMHGAPENIKLCGTHRHVLDVAPDKQQIVANTETMYWRAHPRPKGGGMPKGLAARVSGDDLFHNIVAFAATCVVDPDKGVFTVVGAGLKFEFDPNSATPQPHEVTIKLTVFATDQAAQSWAFSFQPPDGGRWIEVVENSALSLDRDMVGLHGDWYFQFAILFDDETVVSKYSQVMK
jgi:hypothetical protein